MLLLLNFVVVAIEGVRIAVITSRCLLRSEQITIFVKMCLLAHIIIHEIALFYVIIRETLLELLLFIDSELEPDCLGQVVIIAVWQLVTILQEQGSR